ncbi:hypothetical protein LOD50_05395, partial [Xylella fastidiosa subsp. multiplex]|nr:hypothetical protein [Xylella fastidiosa subsp. multiplex]
GRQEFAGWGCQKNLKDGQNRGDGDGVRQDKQSVAEIGMRCPAPCPVKALLARLQGCHQGEALGAGVRCVLWPRSVVPGWCLWHWCGWGY